MSPPTQLRLFLSTPQPGAERRDSLPDRLCALLARRGRPLEVGHVAAQLLRLRRCPERLQRRLVAEIVDGDARLAWLARDLVGLAPENWSGARLDEVSFCVVDLETTGHSPGVNKVTEIGAVRVVGLRSVERFATLVDPGRPIPPVVSELTGIDDTMVAGQPDIERALELFADFAGQDVLVAHNAPFDLRFLNYERRRLAGRYFTQPWLDTLVLARRLLEGRVERHDLRTLADWADTSIRPSHRALPDAEATAELLVALLPLLAERAVETLAEAVRFGGAPGARYAHKLALTEELPGRPGVYLMRDRGGRALYVGKAANLRRRVRSYFGPNGRHGRLIGRALEGLDHVEHEVCGSEFAALLREDELLRTLRPPCNRRGLAPPGRFLELRRAGAGPLGGPLLRVVGNPPSNGDGGTCYGPVRSERMAREAAACLMLLYGDEPAERTELRLLLEGDPSALGLLGGRLAGALGDGRIAVGEEGRRPLAALTGLLAALAWARRAALRQAVLVEPARVPGQAEAFFVANGVVAGRALLSREDWERPARRGLARLRRAAQGVPPRLDPGALGQAMIVEERLRERPGRRGGLVLAPGWRTADALAFLGEAVAELAAPPPAPVASSP